MAEEQKNSSAETVDAAASAAHTVKGAIKAGKAISGAAKGAAAAGPYGAVAGAVWAGRKHIGKIIAVIAILLLLPVLFLLMLPGLIFGGLVNAFSPADPDTPILNSETAIVENANDITFAINAILGEALDDVMARIEVDFASSGADKMEVKNPYSSGLVYNANLIVSQYCAARDEDFESISLDDLSTVLRENKEHLYSYTSVRESREVTSEDPETGEETISTEIWMIYTIRYNGESYLADHVFALILTIRSREEVETQEDREDVIWHEIHNAYRTRRILTGQLGGIEQLDNRKTVAVVDYKGFRIIIPIKEMMINLGRSPSGQEYADLMLRQNKILGNMLGADIDFVVRGIDSKTRSVVASRREAMMRKRQTFYFDLDAEGKYRIYEGRIVQARVIAVAEKVIRVEVFGVETSILARDLAWDWIGDAHERFSVGDEVLVRILNVRRNSLEDLGIRADIKSTSENTDRDNLQKCRIQGKYAGKVTDVHKGVVYVRLANGVNAVAHSCYDYRMPGKKDDVSFAVTHLDVERGIALGIITRIIRQNL